MIKAEVLDAMVAAGCTAEQIAAVVKAAMAASPAGADTPAATRMRRYRQRRVDLGMHYMFEGAKFREALIKRDGEGCVYCGSENGSDVDHMVPIVSGGTDDLDNLAIACKACNGKKSGRTPEEAGMTFANKSAQSEHVRYLGRTGRTSSVEANIAADGFSLSPIPLLPPIPPNNPLTPKPSSKNNKRGHRLPEDWTMSGPDLAYALSKNLSEREAIDLFERFCSWAWAASGPNALKVNWHQAWQGWVQRDGPKIIASRKAGPSGKPLTEFQRKQAETNEVRSQLRAFASGGAGGREADRSLSFNLGDRPADLRGGNGPTVLTLPRASDRGSD